MKTRALLLNGCQCLLKSGKTILAKSLAEA